MFLNAHANISVSGILNLAENCAVLWTPRFCTMHWFGGKIKSGSSLKLDLNQYLLLFCLYCFYFGSYLRQVHKEVA